MASNYVHVGLDLGGDTLKIAFAYTLNSNICYGKFINPSRFTQIAIPALAYYDTTNFKWYYGDQITDDGDSFVTVVKIKNLLSLISNNKDSSVKSKNIEYYAKNNKFPKFYFPVKRDMLSDFSKMVKNDMVFEAEGYTPKSVCQAFFNYVKDLVSVRIAKLQASVGASFDGYKVSIVHPSSMGGDYVDELCALVKNAFNLIPNKVLTANKALAIYAYQRKAVRSGEDFLVFDFGEEEISVVRAGFEGGSPYIEGADGHNTPLKVGGNDVDSAIVSSLEKLINNRETLGTPKAGEKGHIYEDSVYSKQYQLMKDVKRAKVILSRDYGEKSYLNESFPISISRDVIIQRNFSKKDLEGCLGVTKNTGVAKKIADYVIEELSRPLNKDIKKVFISGGLIETYSLKPYIESRIAKSFKNVKILTFDDNLAGGDDFSILSFEDSVYAPAVGCAMVSLKNIEIKMRAPLSFGLWVSENNSGSIIYDIFIERGTEINEGESYACNPYTFKSLEIVDEDIFSTHYTRAEINKNLGKAGWNFTPSGNYIIGNPGTKERKQAEDKIGLKSILSAPNSNGKTKSKITFYHKGRKVYIFGEPGNRVSGIEGVIINKDGSATPFVKNVSPKGKKIKICDATYINTITGKPNGYEYPTYAYATEIELRTENFEKIVITND